MAYWLEMDASIQRSQRPQVTSQKDRLYSRWYLTKHEHAASALVNEITSIQFICIDYIICFSGHGRQTSVKSGTHELLNIFSPHFRALHINPKVWMRQYQPHTESICNIIPLNTNRILGNRQVVRDGSRQDRVPATPIRGIAKGCKHPHIVNLRLNVYKPHFADVHRTVPSGFLKHHPGSSASRGTSASWKYLNRRRPFLMLSIIVISVPRNIFIQFITSKYIYLHYLLRTTMFSRATVLMTALRTPVCVLCDMFCNRRIPSSSGLAREVCPDRPDLTFKEPIEIRTVQIYKTTHRFDFLVWERILVKTTSRALHNCWSHDKNLTVCLDH